MFTVKKLRIKRKTLMDHTCELNLLSLQSRWILFLRCQHRSRHLLMGVKASKLQTVAVHLARQAQRCNLTASTGCLSEQNKRRSSFHQQLPTAQAMDLMDSSVPSPHPTFAVVVTVKTNLWGKNSAIHKISSNSHRKESSTPRKASILSRSLRGMTLCSRKSTDQLFLETLWATQFTRAHASPRLREARTDFWSTTHFASPKDRPFQEKSC